MNDNVLQLFAPPSTPGPSAYTLATTVRADIPALRATSSWLHGLSDTVAHLRGTFSKAGNDSQPAWTGAAANGFRQTLSDQRHRADELAQATHDLEAAVAAFTAEINAVKDDMTSARRTARSAGYTVTADAIHFPMPLRDPAHTGISGAITTTVTLARRRERAAHVSLHNALARQASLLESLLKPTRVLGVARGLFVASTGTKRYLDSAVARASTLRAAAVIADNSTGTLQQSAYSQLFTSAPGVAADEFAGGSRQILTYGAVNWVNPAQDAQYARAFLKPLSVSGGALGVTGIGLSIAGGTPPDKAIVSGTASFAAGATAAGATEAALVALGVSAGPIGWATLAVGTAASVGVGYVIDQIWH